MEWRDFLALEMEQSWNGKLDECDHVIFHTYVPNSHVFVIPFGARLPNSCLRIVENYINWILLADSVQYVHD